MYPRTSKGSSGQKIVIMSEISSSTVILFADIAGSTGLYDRLGDRQAYHCIVTSIELLKRFVDQFDGTVVEVVGDQVMAYFPSAEQAAQSACTIQRHFEETPVLDQQIQIRIGFHYGPVLWDGCRPFGDTVNVASRMVSLAAGRQVVTTAISAERFTSMTRSRACPFGKVNVKGKPHPFNTLKIEWDESDSTSLYFHGEASPVERNLLTLEYKNRVIRLEENQTVFSIGRGGSCDLVVSSEAASRSHARIEYRQRSFIYLDQSSNGSFVMSAGRRVNDGFNLHVHHQEWAFSGSGYLGLGLPVKEGGEEAIHFSVS